jgi:hypothetical protein
VTVADCESASAKTCFERQCRGSEFKSIATSSSSSLHDILSCQGVICSQCGSGMDPSIAHMICYPHPSANASLQPTHLLAMTPPNSRSLNANRQTQQEPRIEESHLLTSSRALRFVAPRPPALIFNLPLPQSQQPSFPQPTYLQTQPSSTLLLTQLPLCRILALPSIFLW